MYDLTCKGYLLRLDKTKMKSACHENSAETHLLEKPLGFCKEVIIRGYTRAGLLQYSQLQKTVEGSIERENTRKVSVHSHRKMACTIDLEVGFDELMKVFLQAKELARHPLLQPYHRDSSWSVRTLLHPCP